MPDFAKSDQNRFCLPAPGEKQRFCGRRGARKTSSKHKGWGGQRARAASEKLGMTHKEDLAPTL